MQNPISRSRTLMTALAAGIVLLLAVLSITLLSSRADRPITEDPTVKATAQIATMMRQRAAARAGNPGAAAAADQRLAQIEAWLKTHAAARDPKRPTMAQLQRELDRMVQEQRAASAPTHGGRLAPWFLGLSLVLALALLGLAVRRAYPNRPVM